MPVHNCKILVVDDVEDVRNTVAGALKDAGYCAKTAGSELEAITALADEKFQFIVIDVRLRGHEEEDESGLELTRIIRNYNIDSQIIFVTGKTVRGRHFKPAREYNVLAYIEKTNDWVAIVIETIKKADSNDSPGDIPLIFLSYAREDEQQVNNLYDKLLLASFKPWMDTQDILPGENWKVAIDNAIKKSDFFIACLSTKSVSKRGFLQKENKKALEIWQEKMENDIYLIPARLEKCDVPNSLTDFQWVDLFTQIGWDKLLLAIEAGIERGL